MSPIANNLAEDEVCPYCDDSADECKASMTSLNIGASLRLKQCKSEAHDNCSLFLAKCLRSGWQFRYAS